MSKMRNKITDVLMILDLGMSFNKYTVIFLIYDTFVCMQ